MSRPRPAKRALDIVLAGLGLIILAPAIAVIALRIRLDRDGPILYRGTRVGLGGRQFPMLKFRTMVVDADRIGGSTTPDDDPRLTRTGRFLRRRKLDEIPQLFNVLTGQMSFVGPRPQVPQEVANYSNEERQLLWVRPGVTDWASLRFHNEGEILKGVQDPDRAYAELIRPEKMRLGLEYVRRATLLDDIKILFHTVTLALVTTAVREGSRAPDVGPSARLEHPVPREGTGPVQARRQ